MKGRVLASPKGLNIRPTSDKVREAIFNIIGQDLSGLRVIDLFAGTGSLGLETLSRGARHALFIDNSQQSINLVRRNLSLCGHEHEGVTLRRNLKKGIPRRHPILKEKFDLAFLDPPYGKNLIPLLLEDLSTEDFLISKARVIVESWKTDKFQVSCRFLEMVDTRLYGDTKISIYTHKAK